MGETTVGHVAGEVVRALYGAGYMESTIGQYRKSIRALERYAGGPDAVYTRGLGAGFAASTFSERTGGFQQAAVVRLRQAGAFCATRICGPVRWTWASGAGAGLRSRWFRVWPWSWSVGRRISPVRDWLRRRWGITVGWRACSSRGWNLMGSCRWMVRMARMCWGSWPGCVHAGRSRRCGTPRRTCARCSDGSGGMTWRTRSAWPAYAGPTRSRERCPTTSTAACWRRAPRGRCRRGTRRSPCCR